MSKSGDGPEVAFEQASNQRYLEHLTRKLSKPIEFGISKNQEWLHGHPHLGQDFAMLHPLVGRVGRDEGDELLPRAFYIGPRHVEFDGATAFSWAAPIARLFFQPDSDDKAAPSVVVRRTFDTHLDVVIDLRDEWVSQPLDPSPFVGPTLDVPAAPSARARRPVATAQPSDVQMEQSSIAEGQLEPTPAAPGMVTGMRAYETVIRRLASPRSERLQSVLATLQPDQHEMTSKPTDEPLIIQGHPGTGKSIIAAYRAAFLADPRGGAIGKVLVVGPTEGYVKHVAGLIAPLASAKSVRVVHMEQLLVEVTGVKPTLGGSMDGEHDDVDALARGLTDGAVRLIRESAGLKSGTGARIANLRAIYDLVRTNGSDARSLSQRADQKAWMAKLPPFDTAIKQRRYLALMAQCALSIQSLPSTDRFEHVIVDEAQDVAPIEWNVLDQFNRTGNWTLVGDLNQRRSDTSYGSWETIAEHLTLGDGTQPVAVTVIGRGYRSTEPILRFADKLLAKDQRGAQTLQVHGPAVGVHRVHSRAPEELGKEALRRARELCGKYRSGTVAVISVNPGMLLQALHKGGWKRGKGLIVWRRANDTVHLHVPESARGLEFDGVVVVEPSAFPRNFGRAGQLYTSLTRANRELAVVHQDSLPDELRNSSR